MTEEPINEESNEVLFDIAGQEENTQPEEPVQSSPQTTQVRRRSERNTRPLIRYGIDEYVNKAQFEEIDEPATIDEALKGNHAKEWKEAAILEYSALMENNTWELVKLPKRRKAIRCNWVFRVKYDGNGEVERFKGRLL